MAACSELGKQNYYDFINFEQHLGFVLVLKLKEFIIVIYESSENYAKNTSSYTIVCIFLFSW